MSLLPTEGSRQRQTLFCIFFCKKPCYPCAKKLGGRKLVDTCFALSKKKEKNFWASFILLRTLINKSFYLSCDAIVTLYINIPATSPHFVPDPCQEFRSLTPETATGRQKFIWRPPEVTPETKKRKRKNKIQMRMENYLNKRRRPWRRSKKNNCKFH